MTRTQAEHILDAYVRMCECDKGAADALREVILDAMTGYCIGTTVRPSWSPMTIPTTRNGNRPIEWPSSPVTCGVDV